MSGRNRANSDWRSSLTPEDKDTITSAINKSSGPTLRVGEESNNAKHEHNTETTETSRSRSNSKSSRRRSSEVDHSFIKSGGGGSPLIRVTQFTPTEKSNVKEEIDKRNVIDNTKFAGNPVVEEYLDKTQQLEDLVLSSYTKREQDLDDITLVDQVLQRSFQLHQKVTKEAFRTSHIAMQELQVELKRRDQTIADLETKIINLEKSLASKDDELMHVDTKAKIAEKKLNNKDIELGLIHHKLKKAQTDMSDKNSKIETLTAKEQEVQNEGSEAMIRLQNEKLLLFEEKCAIADQVLTVLIKQREDNPLNENAKKVVVKIPSYPVNRRGTVVAGDKEAELAAKMARAPTKENPAVPKTKDSVDNVIKETRLNKARDIEFVPGTPITNEQLDSLATVLKLNTTVEYISFAKVKIGDYGAKIIADSLRNNQNVVGFNLECSGITINGAKEAIELLKTNNMIQTVNFNHNFLNNAADQNWAKIVSELLESNHPSLARLGIAGNQIGASGMKEIVKGLEKNHTVTSIDLTGNNLGAEGGAALSQGIIHMGDKCALSSLNLWGNMLNGDGAKGIAEMIKVNRSLKKLNLKGNNLREDGMKLLGPAFLVNPNLTLLDLSGNGLGTDGVKYLEKYIRETTTLLELNLGGNNIAGEAVTVLSGAMRANTSIKFLNLELNLIDDTGAKEIAEVLKENAGLVHLDLGYNRIGLQGALAIKKSIPANSGMKELIFHGNALPEVKNLATTTLETLEQFQQPERVAVSSPDTSKKNAVPSFLRKGQTGTVRLPKTFNFQDLLSTSKESIRIERQASREFIDINDKDS